MIDKKLSNKLPTLRNQMMKKLMSFQSVLHQGAFNKYMDKVRIFLNFLNFVTK